MKSTEGEFAGTKVCLYSQIHPSCSRISQNLALMRGYNYDRICLEGNLEELQIVMLLGFVFIECCHCYHYLPTHIPGGQYETVVRLINPRLSVLDFGERANLEF